MDPTAVNSLIETLLPFIDRSRVSDTFIYTVTEVHLAMEKEQIKDAWIDGVTNWDSEKEVEDYINETFKS